MPHGHDLDPPITRITEVRSEYTSARLICANLAYRLAGTRYQRAPGYLPAEIDFPRPDGKLATLEVRDYDVRHLDRVAKGRAVRRGRTSSDQRRSMSVSKLRM